MIMDSNLITSLKNGFYSFRGAMDVNGNARILVFNITKNGKYFYTDAWHDSTKWIELGQFETVSKDLKKVEDVLKNLDYTEA